MNGLKALVAQRKAQAAEEFGGRKAVRRGELEELRLKRLREEEQREAEDKEARKRLRQASNGSGELMRRESFREEEVLEKEEVVRRLRLLGQPATLFGEEDSERLARLRKAQTDLTVEDEHAGAGQQTNLLLELARGEKGAKKAALKEKAEREREKKAPDSTQKGRPPPDAAAAAGGGEGGSTALVEAGGEGDVEAAFRAAAERLHKQRQEAEAPVEDRIRRALRRWCREWGDDLEARSEEDKDSATGHQAMLMYKQSMEYMKPLLKQLEKRQVGVEMKAGLWLIVQAIRNRNYLHAYDIYMRLSIGNSPWPIGVTSVGIHERSAREKISHVMNGAAHIMNDEATRKYLQALKRLLTFMQRAYPTDPSRSFDFDASHDAGRGAAGSGSDKQALLEAERTGNTWRQLGLAPAPHFLGKDGGVNVPPKWDNILAHSEVYKAEFGERRPAHSSGSSPARSAPRPTTSGTSSPSRSMPAKSPLR